MPRHDNVVSLADRELGACPLCHEPVVFAENFIRAGRAFVHLRCTLAVGPPTRPARGVPRRSPLPDQGA
jgi:hypothetical protein